MPGAASNHGRVRALILDSAPASAQALFEAARGAALAQDATWLPLIDTLFSHIESMMRSATLQYALFDVNDIDLVKFVRELGADRAPPCLFLVNKTGSPGGHGGG